MVLSERYKSGFLLSAMNNLNKFILLSSQSRRIRLFNLFSADSIISTRILLGAAPFGCIREVIFDSKEKLFKSTRIHSFLSVLLFSVVRLPLDLWRDIIELTLSIFRHIKIRCTFGSNNFKSLP